MNVTKTIKFVKYTARVYNIVKKEISTVSLVYLKNTTMKQIKNDIANKGYTLLEIINTEYYTRKYAMEIEKFIDNAENITKEKGE